MTSKRFKQAARACRIALSYEGNDKSEIKASNKTVEKLLLALTGTSDPDIILADLRQQKIVDGLPKVIVCWDGTSAPVWLWMRSSPGTISAELVNENGEAKPVDFKIEDVIFRHNAYRLKLQNLKNLDSGYYKLKVSVEDRVFESLVISSPRRLKGSEKTWGVFAPAYAIRSRHNQGIGGFKDLLDAASFVKQHGGSFIGTLPLLPVCHESNDNSPYSPTSRFFWDEIYLDLYDLPGHAVKDSDFHELNESTYVDYKSTYKAKRDIIRKASDEFFKSDAQHDENFKKFLADTPYLKDYARFDSDEKDENYHLYAQYACHLQIEKFKNADQAQLYLDYPVGVHPDGFDAQRFPTLFLDGFSVGAPPDKLGPNGQNWGFKPLSPKSMIDNKFIYLRQSIQHYFRYAKMIRFDHVMSLYRLYCIPEGEASSNGAYIHYPFTPLLAVLCLETFRHDGILIGENLGTVPAIVNEAMHEHNILRMWISQFHIKKEPAETFSSIDSGMIAGFNTHDMFPFHSTKENHDLDELYRLGIISEQDAAHIKDERKNLLAEWSDDENSFLGLLEKLASSPARFVIVNMEDLWQEMMPQNIPGTTSEYPN